MLLVEQGREMFIQRPNGSSSVSSDPGERYIRVPEHGVSNSSSYDMSAASALSSPLQPNTAAGGYPSVFPVLSEVTSFKESGDDSAESYIRLEDCYSGTSSTLPVYSASRGGQIMLPNKASKQECASSSFGMDATSRFGDCVHHKVEYCNEYELGEHNSLFLTVKSFNFNCANDVVRDYEYECNVDDTDNDDEEENYCHYKYPTNHYSICHSMLPELSGTRSVTERHFQEPVYMNCSYMTDLNRNSRRELFPMANQHDINCQSVLTPPPPELPKLFCQQPSSSHLLSLSNREHRDISTCSSDSWNSCRFYPCHDVTKAATADADDGDDDDDDDAHNYVNVPPLPMHFQSTS